MFYSLNCKNFQIPLTKNKTHQDLPNNNDSMIQDKKFFKLRLDTSKKSETTINKTRHSRKLTSQSNNKRNIGLKSSFMNFESRSIADNKI